VNKSLEHIINECKKQNSEAQKALYDMYKDTMYAVCLRYIKSAQDAEDVFIEAFFKVYDKISSYKGDGSFEGWVRRIMINECLMWLRKRNNLHMTVEISDKDMLQHSEELPPIEEFSEVLSMLDELPTGYRTIFNLYVFEKLKHREIAEQLGISINTSKSQLILAKKKLLDIYKKKHKSVQIK